MSDLGQWITGTATCTGADPVNEAAVIIEYLECDESASLAGLFLDIHLDDDNGRFTLHRGLDATSHMLASFATLAGLGRYLDGYLAGQAAAE